MVLLYECFEFDLLSLLNPLAVMHKFKLSYLLTEQGRKSHWIKHTTQNKFNECGLPGPKAHIL